MKTLDVIKARPHVLHVDDERDIGNGVIITLGEGWAFKLDPDCGVMGFDTLTEAKQGTSIKEVTPKSADTTADG